MTVAAMAMADIGSRDSIPNSPRSGEGWAGAGAPDPSPNPLPQGERAFRAQFTVYRRPGGFRGGSGHPPFQGQRRYRDSTVTGTVYLTVTGTVYLTPLSLRLASKFASLRISPARGESVNRR